MSSSEVIVTITGSITPSVVLPKGETRTVALTPRIQRLIDRGYVTELARHEIAKPKQTRHTPPPPTVAVTPAEDDEVESE